MRAKKLLKACWFLVAYSFAGCAGTKTNGMLDLETAWSLMETGKVVEAMDLAKRHLYSSDAEEIFVVALLYHGRATSSTDLVQAKKDELCSIALLEKSANLGHLNAAATLGPFFTYEPLIKKDKARAACWDQVVENGKAPSNCLQENSLDACLR